jgi:plasmid maintenance system antidote protein VapI
MKIEKARQFLRNNFRISWKVALRFSELLSDERTVWANLTSALQGFQRSLNEQKQTAWP